MTTIKENIFRVRAEIARICQKVRRDPREITLVAVTKFAPLEAIQEAIDCGITDIAENKVQEGLKKYPSLKSSDPQRPCKRHLIGHLQTNKVKDALKIFDLIQSMDSLKLAQEIDQQALYHYGAGQAQKLNRRIEILVQVNISGEEQKFGLGKSEARDLVGKILELENIHILGLMTMAPLTDDQKIMRECFKGLRELKDEVIRDFKGNPNMDMKFLSMGMSGDYSIALEEGANMIRIGRAIFQD